MTNEEEAKANLKHAIRWNDMPKKETLEVAVKALDREPCGDAISRQAVNTLIDELARAISDERCCISRGRSTATIMRDILHLPPVTPQSKTGHWIYKQYGGYPEQGNYHCSECDKIDNHIPEYCPHCGRAMIEPRESEG